MGPADLPTQISNRPVTLILRDDEVEQLLGMEECIELMAETFRAFAAGDFHQPLRSVVTPPKAPSLLGLMPAYRALPEPIWGAKVLCLAPENPKRGLDIHQGAVLVFEGGTGKVRTIANASAVTRLRTAAVSAVATRALARRDASVLAIVGAGVQARSHLQALTVVHEYRDIRIASRSPESARAVAASHALVRAAADVESAVRGADVIVTVTSSHEPVLRREWLQPGAHVTAVGASVPTAREIDTRTVAEASLFVDSVESAKAESGDYLIPLAEGAIDQGHIRAELGDVLVGRHPGRVSPDELTLFKSLGLAVEDLVVAATLGRRAWEQGVGTEIEL